MNHQFFPDPLGTSHFAKKPGRGQSGPGEERLGKGGAVIKLVK